MFSDGFAMIVNNGMRDVVDPRQLDKVLVDGGPHPTGGRENVKETVAFHRQRNPRAGRDLAANAHAVADGPADTDQNLGFDRLALSAPFPPSPERLGSSFRLREFCRRKGQ